MQQQHRIHVGKLIRERLKEEGKSVVWLAQELGRCMVGTGIGMSQDECL